MTQEAHAGVGDAGEGPSSRSRTVATTGVPVLVSVLRRASASSGLSIRIFAAAFPPAVSTLIVLTVPSTLLLSGSTIETAAPVCTRS